MTVNGKTANAVNSISGTVSNGNLKIAVNGVESGDIPLPESYPIINLKEHSASEINISGTFTVSSIETTDIKVIDMLEVSVARDGVTGGTYFNSLVKNKDSISNSVFVSTDKYSKYEFTSRTIQLIPRPFVGIYLEDGTYKMPVDMLRLNLGTGLYMARKLNSNISDDEYLEFNIESGAFTYIKPPIINSANYMTDSRISATIVSIIILYDRIIKVN